MADTGSFTAFSAEKIIAALSNEHAIFVAYSALCIMAVTPIYFGSFMSVKGVKVGAYLWFNCQNFFNTL